MKSEVKKTEKKKTKPKTTQNRIPENRGSTTKKFNICITGILEREEREKGTEEFFSTDLTDNSLLQIITTMYSVPYTYVWVSGGVNAYDK